MMSTCCRYMPILPMVLINGAEGIGTGWSTSIPNYNPRDVVANLKRYLAGEPLEPMQPWYVCIADHAADRQHMRCGRGADLTAYRLTGWVLPQVQGVHGHHPRGRLQDLRQVVRHQWLRRAGMHPVSCVAPVSCASHSLRTERVDYPVLV